MEEDEKKQGQEVKGKSGISDVLKKTQGKSFGKIIAKKILIAIGPYVAIAIVIAVIVLALMDNFVDSKKQDTGSDALSSSTTATTTDDGEEIPAKIELQINQDDECNGAYRIIYNYTDDELNEKIEEVKKYLSESKKFNIKKIASDEVWKFLAVLADNGENLENYNSVNELNNLYLFYKAEIASVSLDLRDRESMFDSNGNYNKITNDIEKGITYNGINDDLIYGTVRVKRDGNKKITVGDSGQVLEEYLTYMDSEIFDEKVVNNEIDVLNYFTLDESDNLIIAKWSYTNISYSYSDNTPEDFERSTGTYDFSISTFSKVPYKNLISKYTMSYEYLTALMIKSDSTDFAKEVAELVNNITMTVTLQETLTDTYMTQKNNYAKTIGKQHIANYTVEGKGWTDASNWVVKKKNMSKKDAERWAKLCGYADAFTGVTFPVKWYSKNGTYWKVEEIQPKDKEHDTATYTLYMWENGKSHEAPRESATELVMMPGYYKKVDDITFSEVETIDFVETISTHIQSNSYLFEVTEVDTWFVYYRKDFEIEETATDLSSSSETRGEFGEPTESTIENYQKGQGIPCVDAFIEDKIAKYKSKYAGKYKNPVTCTIPSLKTKTYQKLDLKSVISGTATKYEVKEVPDSKQIRIKVHKTKKDEEFTQSIIDLENEEKVKIDENCFMQVYHENSHARYILKNDYKAFFEILERNEKTIKLSDITKYMMYLYDETDFGVTELDLTLYEPEKFKELTISMNLAKYLRQFSHEDEAPKTSDGKFYIMYGDGVGWPTIGDADLQWASHHSKFNVSGTVLENGVEKTVASIESYVNNKLGGSGVKLSDAQVASLNICIDVGIVDEIGDDVQEVYYEAVKNLTGGLNLSRQQLFALTAIQYNFGHLPTRNGYTFKQVYLAGAEKYEINSWEHNKFIWDNWWCYLGGGAAGHIPARDAAFETYVKGVFDFKNNSYTVPGASMPAGTVFGRNYYIYYTQAQLNNFSYSPRKTVKRNASNEEEIFTYVQSSGSIIECCISVMEDLINRGVRYTGTLYWNDIEASKQSSGCVCATYVTLVLYQAGLLEKDHINKYNYNYCGSGGVSDMLEAAGWTLVGRKGTSINDLEPGDVINVREHVFIYAGDNYYYDQRCAVWSTYGAAPTGDKRYGTTDYLNKYPTIEIWRAP